MALGHREPLAFRMAQRCLVGAIAELEQVGAAADFRDDAERKPGRLPLLPISLARIQHREGWNPEPLLQGLRIGPGTVRIGSEPGRKFGFVESGQSELEPGLVQGAQLEGEQFVVPFRLFGRAVVGQPVGPHLGRCQPPGDMDRHLCAIPSDWAARSRVCPATTTPFPSTTIGCRQPNSLSEAATLATASAFCRGLPGYGLIESIGTVETFTAGPQFPTRHAFS